MLVKNIRKQKKSYVLLMINILKKIKNKKNPRCQQQADFFPLLRKKHTKTLFFLLENEKWRRKRDWKVLKSKVKSFFQAENKKQNKVKKTRTLKEKSSKLSPIFYTPLYKQFKPIFITTEKQNKKTGQNRVDSQFWHQKIIHSHRQNKKETKK